MAAKAGVETGTNETVSITSKKRYVVECCKCKAENSRLSVTVEKLEAELREKDRLIINSASIVLAQAKQIRLSGLPVSPALMPAGSTQSKSELATTIPWIPPETDGNRSGGRSSPELPSELPLRALNTSETNSHATANVPVALAETGEKTSPETQIPASFCSSTPIRSAGVPTSLWSEVVRGGKPALSKKKPQTLDLSNRFDVLTASTPRTEVIEPGPLSEGIPTLKVHPGSGQLIPPPFRVRGANVKRRSQGPAPSPRRMLRRHSTGTHLTHQPENGYMSVQALHKERKSSPANSSRKQFTHPPPLLAPATLIIGDSIIRKVRFFNAITNSYPGATAPTLLDKLLTLLPCLPSTISKIILHVGYNDTTKKESELTKKDFDLLFEALNQSGKRIFISGPIPSVYGGSERFSRILNLHSWLQQRCKSWIH